jgi:L-lactate utilization protein LutC
LADNPPRAALEHPKKFLYNPIGHAYTEVVHMSWQITPHALTTSCDAAAAIFNCVCAKRVTYFGRNTTSCVETSEDALPTIFNQVFHRSESPNLAVSQPHAFEKLQYPSAIFRHAITWRFHNRADNQSSAFKTSKNISSAECPAYTKVVHMA